MRAAGTALDERGRQLRDRLLQVFAAPANQPLDDAAFDRLARDVFTYQFQHNAPFAAYCARRGVDPATLDHWTAIPAVPTAAFKTVALSTAPPAAAQIVFRTSGTTRGEERRGTHYVPDLSIYHAALLPQFAAHVLPDGAVLPMLALVPPAAQIADSSLAHMCQVVMDRLGGADSAHYVSVEHGLEHDALEQRLRRAQAENTPVCLLGTSFSFVHFTDGLRDRGVRLRLPAGSRLMDTGGYKGRSREVPENELRAAYTGLLDLDADYCINEYGMTELCSQFYDSSLRERAIRGRVGERRKLGPPWVRTRVVDPDTLQPLAVGRTGLLQHCDLANMGSVLVVQTEDVGRATEDGFVVLGRAAGATPRGCSIAMDEVLRASRNPP